MKKKTPLGRVASEEKRFRTVPNVVKLVQSGKPAEARVVPVNVVLTPRNLELLKRVALERDLSAPKGQRAEGKVTRGVSAVIDGLIDANRSDLEREAAGK